MTHKITGGNEKHLVNMLDYLHGHLLIYYKHENTVIRKFILAIKVTVALNCVQFLLNGVHPVKHYFSMEY